MDDIEANIAPTGITSTETTSTEVTSLERNNTNGQQAHNTRMPGLLIGVEIEAPLAMTKWNELTAQNELLDTAASIDELAILFNNKGLKAYGTQHNDQNQEYRTWCITIDPSLEPLGIQYPGAGFEIKTPIIAINNPIYKRDIQTMWGIIEPFKVPSMRYWKLCSTHIHFSLSGYFRFPIDLARKLAFCVVYFERAIDDLMPGTMDPNDQMHPQGWKNGRFYAKRNRLRPRHNGLKPLNDLKSCWECIRSAEDIRELYRLLCGGAFGAIVESDDYSSGKTHRLFDIDIETCGGRFCKWNFAGVDDVYVTIEFRQMPPCRSAEETLDWIGFLTAFLAAVEKVDTAKLDQAVLPPSGITFAKALGLDLNLPPQVERNYETKWAADSPPYQLPVLHLKDFVGHDFDFWLRLLAVKDKMESELEAILQEEQDKPSKSAISAQ
ncbi:hypothetical protein F5B22DRAFT_656478 [Xylaria bambusicola]|uniref:uncharacterized protein n=1 Tax=Xylaria bambusicola TaxID=326684 RepID=UPI0020086CD6|nr:uncharacterized protein F5B22DRAFT_656478 [Xylaria bambusicola]KAI0514967.1 hypothetical protein F5B22DRAFT_656478 [Xylaria bambusicola]